MAADDEWALPPEVLALPGYKVLSSLQALGDIVRIFRANARALVRWTARTDDPAVLVATWNADKPQELDDHLNETTRLLFNFVASVHSRVDYYRNVVNEGLLSDLEPSYQERVDVFRADPVHLWLIDLRREMLHHRLPVARGTMRWKPGSLRTSTVIMTQRLLHSSSFGATARAWMRERDEVDLRVTIPEYCDRVTIFDEWFSRAFGGQHLEVAEEFLRARAVAAQDRIASHLAEPVDDPDED